jgi:hypothetical protein
MIYLRRHLQVRSFLAWWSLVSSFQWKFRPEFLPKKRNKKLLSRWAKRRTKNVHLINLFLATYFTTVPYVDSNQRKKIFFKVCNSLYQEALLKYSQAQKVWPIMLVGDFESTTLLWQKIISQFKKVFVS